MKTIINIEGMSCENCVKHVKTALKEINGVNSVDVSLENKNAVIEHTEEASANNFIEAIEEAGYEALS